MIFIRPPWTHTLSLMYHSHTFADIVFGGKHYNIAECWPVVECIGIYIVK
jgi:hypothetical protein